MIDPKLNISSRTIHSSPIQSDLAIAREESAVQTRAYELYELRGKIDGRAEQDWYQAETDLRSGNKQG